MKSGWCSGPEGAVLKCGSCRFAGCGCECHTTPGAQQNKAIRGKMGAIETAPGGALTPESQGLADYQGVDC